MRQTTVTTIYATIVDMRFADWLLAELAARDWNQSDLAKFSGLTKQAITNYVGGRIPDTEAIQKIARAFKIRPEEVFRVAIGEPAEPDRDEWVDEQTYKLEQIPPEMRPLAGRVIAGLVEDAQGTKTRTRKLNAAKYGSNR